MWLQFLVEASGINGNVFLIGEAQFFLILFETRVNANDTLMKGMTVWDVRCWVVAALIKKPCRRRHHEGLWT